MKRKKRIRPPPERSFEREKGSNPIEGSTGWQADRYDPEYRADANNDPLFITSPSDKTGYYLILVAIILLIVSAAGIRTGKMDWYAVSVTMALMLFLFLVGFKLIKKQPAREARPGRRRSKLDD